MKKHDREKLIDILAANQGAPILVQFGDTVNDVVKHDRICLVRSHASMIQTLVNEGYSLYLNDGKLKIDKF